MDAERTLIMIKPDGVERGLVGEIFRRFEQRGLTILGLKMDWLTRERGELWYAEHEGKRFFNGLVAYITSGPVVALAIGGPDAIQMTRIMAGATNPLNAAPGTIRGDLAISIARNLVHASDSPWSGEREVSFFFTPAELIGKLPGARSVDPWIFEM